MKHPFDGETIVHCVVHPLNIDYKPHTSTIMELMYVCRGSITHIIGNDEISISEGQLLLTSPGTTHAVLPTSRNDLAVNITASADFFNNLEDISPSRSISSDFFANLRRQNQARGEYMIYDVSHHIPIQNLLEVLFVSFFPIPEEKGTGYKHAEWSVDDLNRTTTSCLSNILFYLHKDLSAFSYDIPESKDQMILRSTKVYIENNYRNASLATLASQLNYSESVLSRTIYRLSGHSFKEHLQMYRFQKASELLQKTSIPIADVAAAVGYENFSYFYKKFRAFYGYTPAQYRKQISRGNIPSMQMISDTDNTDFFTFQ